MRNSTASATRVTLLERLMTVPDDPATWADFAEWSGRRIYAWCLAWGLQEADAQDVTQEVFLNLSVRMQNFHYDPKGSFRAWLKTLTHHAWHDYLERQRKPGRGTGSDTAMGRLEAVEARDDLARRMAEAFDEELFKEAAACPTARESAHLGCLPTDGDRRTVRGGGGGAAGDEGGDGVRRPQQGAADAARGVEAAGSGRAGGPCRAQRGGPP